MFASHMPAPSSTSPYFPSTTKRAVIVNSSSPHLAFLTSSLSPLFNVISMPSTCDPLLDCVDVFRTGAFPISILLLTGTDGDPVFTPPDQLQALYTRSPSNPSPLLLPMPLTADSPALSSHFPLLQTDARQGSVRERVRHAHRSQPHPHPVPAHRQLALRLSAHSPSLPSHHLADDEAHDYRADSEHEEKVRCGAPRQASYEQAARFLRPGYTALTQQEQYHDWPSLHRVAGLPAAEKMLVALLLNEPSLPALPPAAPANETQRRLANILVSSASPPCAAQCLPLRAHRRCSPLPAMCRRRKGRSGRKAPECRG